MAPTPGGTNGNGNGHANGNGHSNGHPAGAVSDGPKTRRSDLLRRSRPARVGPRRHMPLKKDPPTMRELPLILFRLLLCAVVVAPALWYSVTTLTDALADRFSRESSTQDCAVVPASALGPPNCITGPG